jgi:hypothetical protein
MTRFFARLWAKHSAYVEQLEKEAAAIEQNIAREVEKDEYKNLAGQGKYEADKEKRDAEKVIEGKRATAKQEAENAKGGEDAAKVFRQNAENSRTVA